MCVHARVCMADMQYLAFNMCVCLCECLSGCLLAEPTSTYSLTARVEVSMTATKIGMFSRQVKPAYMTSGIYSLSRSI